MLTWLDFRSVSEASQFRMTFQSRTESPGVLKLRCGECAGSTRPLYVNFIHAVWIHSLRSLTA